MSCFLSISCYNEDKSTDINTARGHFMKFMDFCAGIGGGRLGLEESNMECVAHSEINMTANHTYRLFFGTEEKNYGDLMAIDTKTLPDFDVLIGGFPCQTFSIVGKREGFADSRGQIIYGLIKILAEKKHPLFYFGKCKRTCQSQQRKNTEGYFAGADRHWLLC